MSYDGLYGEKYANTSQNAASRHFSSIGAGTTLTTSEDHEWVGLRMRMNYDGHADESDRIAIDGKADDRGAGAV